MVPSLAKLQAGFRLDPVIADRFSQQERWRIRFQGLGMEWRVDKAALQRQKGMMNQEQSQAARSRERNRSVKYLLRLDLLVWP